MKLFYTPSTQHLAAEIAMPVGRYTAKQFSDGEWYVKIDEDVNQQEVWVIASTNQPADTIIVLLLLLNALQRSGARINLLFTYFAYTRQDHPEPQEAASAQMICTMLNQYPLQKVVIVHAHSLALHNYLKFENVWPIQAICTIAKSYQAVAAPDQGASALVKQVSLDCTINAILLTKIRPEQETVKILEHDGLIKNQNILIVDDIIATGNTIIEVAKILKKLGAKEVSVWATHGIFSGNAIATIETSAIKKVYVTNSVAQKHSCSKIEVITIAPLLAQIMKQ